MSSPSRFAALSIASLALLAALAPAAPEKPDSNQALAREQLKVIDLAFKDMDAMMSGGQLNLSDPKFALWGLRKIEALRRAKVGKEEMIAALSKYLDRMKENEQFLTNAHRAGIGTLMDLRDTQYRRLEAEIWLNEEKAR